QQQLRRDFAHPISRTAGRARDEGPPRFFYECSENYASSGIAQRAAAGRRRTDRGAERAVLGADAGDRDELRQLLLLGQDRADDLFGAAGDAGGEPGGLSTRVSAGAEPDAAHGAADAEAVADSR